jgi:hypothetical protein
MPWLHDTVEPLKSGLDGVAVSGTEFLTSVVATSTGSTLPPPTQTGDALYTIPLHPKFLIGSRLLQFAALYQKYKYKRLVVEYIPIVPSIQDGSLLMFYSYDPDDNIFTNMNGDIIMREAMARQGSHMFNVYTYGRVHLVDDGTLDWYFFRSGGEARFENQGQLFVMAASTFSDQLGENQITLGNLVIHYEVEFCERSLSDLIEIPSYQVINHPGIWQELFMNTLAGMPLQVDMSELRMLIPALVGVTTGWMLVIVCNETALLDGNPMHVHTSEFPSGIGVTLFELGSIWYIYPSNDAPHAHAWISTSLEMSFAQEPDAFLEANISNPADSFQFGWRTWLYLVGEGS